jgi:hypothetical protein
VPALAVQEIDRVFREEYGRAVAVLVRVFGDIDIAEEGVQDAFTAPENTGTPRLRCSMRKANRRTHRQTPPEKAPWTTTGCG